MPCRGRGRRLQPCPIPTRDAASPIAAIVDDDAAVCRALAALVRSARYQARCFASGREVLDEIAANVVGCAVLNVRMPGREGPDVVAALSRMGSEVPVVFVTARDSPALRTAVGQWRASLLREARRPWLRPFVPACRDDSGRSLRDVPAALTVGGHVLSKGVIMLSLSGHSRAPRAAVAVFAWLAAAAVPVHAQVTGGVAGKLPAALVPALQEIKTELALTDDQTAEAGRLLSDRVNRASAVVENFGGISFESVLDLLVAARSIRDEFIPELSALLTDEQKTKLASLPKAHEIYVSAMAGWFAEARLGKLATRLNLNDGQMSQVRTFLTDEFRDAAGILEGLIKKDAEKSSKSAILDAVVDLRSVQRQGQRNIERILSPEQKEALEAYQRESENKSKKSEGATR